MQEAHAASLATLQTELDVSKHETVAAKVAADSSVKEAVIAADKKVQRLTERTAKVSINANEVIIMLLKTQHVAMHC